LDAAIPQFHAGRDRVDTFRRRAVGTDVLWAPMNGPEAASFRELFETRVRYTGVSLMY